MTRFLGCCLFVFLLLSCKEDHKLLEMDEKKEVPFVWEGANLYFLLTDRFNNGDTSNDLNFDRTK
ncbi:MAG: alpha-amylase, partial [Gelidibacter sp.]